MRTAAIALSVIILLSACGGETRQVNEPNAAGGVASSAKPPEGVRVYRVVTENNYPPFTMHDGKGNSLGFEVELLQAIGERENLYFSFTPQIWEGVLSSLKNGEADIAAAGLTVLEEREKEMSFTRPHFISETAMLMPQHMAGEIKRFTDLRGKRVAVKKDSLQHEFLKQIKHDSQNILFGETIWLNTGMVLNNRVDVVLGDWGALSYHNNAYPENKMTVVQDATSRKEELAFAVKKDETALLQSLNNGLDKLKQDGTYQKLYYKWFGMNAAAASASVQP